MSDLSLLAIDILNKAQNSATSPLPQSQNQIDIVAEVSNTGENKSQKHIPNIEIKPPEFSQQQLQINRNFRAFLPSNKPKPVSGAQLYYQRLAAIKNGQIYTRLPGDSYYSFWSEAFTQPTYQDWQWLLAKEARAIAKGQGSNRLAILLGDSLSLWYPIERLPSGKIWLNQAISGDTTEGILNRLHFIEKTRPNKIYIMAGINDLKRGDSDGRILYNFRLIMQELRQQHPQAEIIIQSILPTRYSNISNSRIRYINQEIAAIAREEGATYLDLYSYLSDMEGNLRWELTTDGLHLNSRGYAMWQLALQQEEFKSALKVKLDK